MSTRPMRLTRGYIPCIVLDRQYPYIWKLFISNIGVIDCYLPYLEFDCRLVVESDGLGKEGS